MAAPGMLDDELIAKIKNIHIRASRLVNDVFAGEYESAFKGRGLEFEEVREYLPGDDVRSIDWNVTARYSKPYIKTFKDERELTVIFVVDVSASSRFGTKTKFKNEVAAEITALLAYTALKNNDKVGLLIFSDHVEHYLPPKKGKGHIWRVIREILAYRSDSKKTHLGNALEFLNQIVKRRAVVFLISDFLDQDDQTQLRTTSQIHDLIAFGIYDDREVNLPNVGYIELEDAETGESILVNTTNKQVRNEFKKIAEFTQQKQEVFFKSLNIDFIQMRTDENYIDPIIKFFRVREKKMFR